MNLNQQQIVMMVESYSSLGAKPMGIQPGYCLIKKKPKCRHIEPRITVVEGTDSLHITKSKLHFATRTH